MLLLFRILVFVSVIAQCCVAYCQDPQVIRPVSVSLISKSQRPSYQINPLSNLFFNIDLTKVNFPLSSAVLTLPIKTQSRGFLLLRAAASVPPGSKLGWNNRPKFNGPVLAKIRIRPKQSSVSADLTGVIKNSQIYSFAYYGIKGSAIGVKTNRGRSFFPKLKINPALSSTSIVRGPYLQRGSPNSMIIRWRTDIPGDSAVYYGTDPSDLKLSSIDSAFVLDHRVEISGLSANTKYYYRVGNNLGSYQSADLNQFFVTSPLTDSSKDTRVWVVGDSGTADANARAVRDAYLNFTGEKPTDLWLMLGDNAYNTGQDSEYQSAVFDMYPSILKNSVLWPTVGNHDSGDSASVNQSAPYFSIFSLPKQAQAGGIASGTESYYSFDYGDIHFISLNSMGSEHRAKNSTMKAWLTADLANATTKKWIVAFWHHPPYSKGSHNSDSEIPLREMRENFLATLEDGGVDLILSGHSHSYERSFLVDGYYGLSGDFKDSYKKSPGGGPYSKKHYAAHAGTVYIVAGSSGKVESAALNHPVMFKSQATLGSVVLDFRANALDVRFLSSTGSINDIFTINKTP